MKRASRWSPAAQAQHKRWRGALAVRVRRHRRARRRRHLLRVEAGRRQRRSSSPALLPLPRRGAPRTPRTYRWGGVGDGDAPNWPADEGGETWAEGDDEHERDEPTEAELKEQWQLDTRLLAWVKAQGLAADHPRRVQAEEQVAESKRAWQESRPRAATSSRMRWAEEALTKARRGMARMEQSIDDLDQWYETEREERQRSLHELRAKVKMREEHLAEIVRQAAEDVSACPHPPAPPTPQCDSGTESLRMAFDSLGQGIGPALEQIREATAEGSVAHQQVNCALAAVANLYGFLGDAVAKQQQHTQQQQDQWWQQQRQAHAQSDRRWWPEEGQAGGPGTARYDISDEWAQDGGGWDRWDGGHADGGSDGWGGRPWTEADWARQRPAWLRESQQGTGEAEWAVERGAGVDGRMDTDEVRGPKWMRRAAAADSDHGERSWKKGRKEEGEAAQGATGSAAGGTPGATQAAAGSADGQPMGQAGASETPGANETGATAREEAEALAARREEIVRQASADGIETGGIPKLEEGRGALEAWASKNLL